VVGTTVVAAEEESLGLHVDVGGVVGESGDFVGEENGGGVQVLAHAVAHYPSQLLYLLFSHFLFLEKKKMQERDRKILR